MKRIFNINDFPGAYCMYCRIQEEVSKFCSYMHAIGRTWFGGESYESDTH